MKNQNFDLDEFRRTFWLNRFSRPKEPYKLFMRGVDVILVDFGADDT